MASQLTKRGYKYRVLPTNDSDIFNDFLNDDSEFNIKKLDTDLEKLDDKVLLGGERQQKFDFIENKVEQDGLVSFGEGSNNVVSLTGDTISIVLKPNTVWNTWDSILTQSVSKLQCEFTSSNGFWVYIGSKKLLFNAVDAVGTTKDIVLIISSNKVMFQCGDKIFIGTHENAINLSGNFKVSNNNCKYTIYNRQLTPQEIQHILSFLNNSPSIKELHTTDSAGKTSILPTLYKESKKARGTLIEIPYDEPRDLENYIYKFI